jgi:hypothetical protein
VTGCSFELRDVLKKYGSAHVPLAPELPRRNAAFFEEPLSLPFGFANELSDFRRALQEIIGQVLSHELLHVSLIRENSQKLWRRNALKCGREIEHHRSIHWEAPLSALEAFLILDRNTNPIAIWITARKANFGPKINCAFTGESVVPAPACVTILSVPTPELLPDLPQRVDRQAQVRQGVKNGGEVGSLSGIMAMSPYSRTSLTDRFQRAREGPVPYAAGDERDGILICTGTDGFGERSDRQRLDLFHTVIDRDI